MSEREPAAVAGIPETVLDELAQTLTDKIDVLLDRLTDRALATPQAGSTAWKTQWQGRDSEDGRREHARRLYVRAVLANRAGIGLTETPAALPAPVPPARRPAARARGRTRTMPAAEQLAMF
ncbi:hypothetical protein DK926_19415 [Rhodococcus sp. Eu-32]|uniref:hypothetical protein n=1 Tax=Rhodococcus sp. Eu-32 TaxID=1017319 RepID=UPI000DF11517|nr:hypothetical protein [Rhodococcus sp. Eu-32]RRQ26169.1 hypothetical protein DK926_19415 [Rhodococcus sp. Eu-32]